MIHIKLLHLHCLLNDESDQDEVFLKHKGSRIWPDHGRYHKMNSGDRVEIQTSLSHDPATDLDIELWDWDLFSKNDLIGTFHIHLNQGDYGKFNSSLRKSTMESTASYMLEWEIVES